MTEHDITGFADGLGSKLSARSRHVCVFLGAGSSMACGLPGIATLQTLVAAGLDAGDKVAFERQLRDRNLEQALSRVRRIQALLADHGGEVDDLDAAAAGALDRGVCRLVVEQLTSPVANLEPVLRFASWAAQANYDQPLELFTVNYDLLFETALESLGVPYFDGFMGSLRARFRTDLVEATPRDSADWLPAFLVRLWKLHGSVNWEWEEGERAEVVRLGAPVASGRPAAIYPSDAKYEESRRVPFVVLQDRFRRSLQVPETLLLISGYSWTDEHINEVLFDAARRRPRTEFISFSYSELPEALVARAEAMPNVQAIAGDEAILGGVRASWAPAPAPIPDVWDGDKCLLGDFVHLAALLARSSPSHGQTDQRVAELITNLVSADG